MADIYCVAVHVVGRTQLYEGVSVLCIGGGPAGLSIAQIAELRGAKEIVLSDPSPIARKVIGEIGRYTVLDPLERDLVSSIVELRGNRKFAAIYDSVGSEETMTTALGLLEESGTYVNLAVHSANISLDATALGSERTLTTSSNAFYHDLSEVFGLLNAKTIDVAPLITHRFPLEDYERAFELLLRSPKGAFKVVFEPQAKQPPTKHKEMACDFQVR